MLRRCSAAVIFHNLLLFRKKESNSSSISSAIHTNSSQPTLETKEGEKVIIPEVVAANRDVKDATQECLDAPAESRNTKDREQVVSRPVPPLPKKKRMCFTAPYAHQRQPTFLGSSTRYCTATTTEVLLDLEKAPLTHAIPLRLSDRLSIRFVKFMRWFGDKLYGEQFLHRAVMLKHLACVPSLSIATVDFLRVLFRGNDFARAKRGILPVVGVSGNGDLGGELRMARALWSVVENHCMHCDVLAAVSPPSWLNRSLILFFFVVEYLSFVVITLFSPRFSHRFAGYLSEEASVAFTHMINDIDVGKVSDIPAPHIAVRYWGIEGSSAVLSTPTSETNNERGREGEEKKADVDGVPTAAGGGGGAVATLRDVVLLIRADEMDHRDFHHRVAEELECQKLRRGKGTAFL